MFNLKKVYILFIILCYSKFIIGQQQQQQQQREDCNKFNKCGLCLRNPGCVWCKDVKFTSDKSEYNRCGTLESHKNKCNDLVELEKPSSKEEELNDLSQNIKPNGYTIKLGVEQTQTIELIYKDPGNKPLDLYYLMDLSDTMRDDKAAVIELGNKLAVALKSTTEDLQMGFGSFIDKPLMPYATLGQINIKETDDTTKPYGFRNHLNLTSNHSAFKDAVMSAKNSLNLDAPEGGLDAIMQAIVCKTQIGWRKEALRMLVLSTDGNFHIAGDGKLGGIVTPNDGLCHMENNMYTHSTLLDYPSISQIISKVQEEKIFVIFAVVESERTLYEEFAKHLHPYASTIILNNESTDVDKLVKDQYDRIRTRVELLLLVNNIIQTDNTKLSTFIELGYSSKCNPTSPFISGHMCERVGSGDELRFKIDVKLRHCPENEEQWKTHFDISTGSDTLRVNLDLNCGCKCETQDNSGGSQYCNEHGNIRCGICSCNSEYLGLYCQCPKNGTIIGNYDDETKCKKSGFTACSGKGKCFCGQCICDKEYRGDFCECNQKNCPMRNGIKCSGNGNCPCETCICNPGFIGSSCECSNSQTNCKRPGDDKICSGAGQCKCNRCECTGRQSGKYCQDCFIDGFCTCLKEVEDHIRCTIIPANATHVKKLELKDPFQCINKTLGPNSEVDLKLQHSIERIKNGQELLCSIKFEARRTDCLLHYIYGYKEGSGDKLYIGVKIQLDCPIILPVGSPLPIIFGTIGTILIIGILTLLLWKIFTYCHDKREYTRFEQERKDAKWDSSGNPLYKEATSTFKNPAYSE